MEPQLSQGIQVWLEMWSVLDSLESTSGALLRFCHFVHSQKQDEERKREGKSSVETVNPPVCCLFLVSLEVFGFVIFHFDFRVAVQEHMLLPTFMSLYILVTSPAVPSFLPLPVYIQPSLWRPGMKTTSRETLQSLQSNSTHSDRAIYSKSSYSYVIISHLLMHCFYNVLKFCIFCFYFPDYESNLSATRKTENTFKHKGEEPEITHNPTTQR